MAQLGDLCPEQPPTRLSVLRGAAHQIVVEGGPAPHTVANGCELDTELKVVLHDRFGAPTDQKPTDGGGGGGSNHTLKWSVVAPTPGLCVLDFKESRHTSPRLQGRILTTAVLEQEEQVTVTVQYGPLKKNVTLAVRPGPVPRRLLVSMVSPDTAGELVEEDGKTLLQGICTSNTEMLPELAVYMHTHAYMHACMHAHRGASRAGGIHAYACIHAFLRCFPSWRL